MPPPKTFRPSLKASAGCLLNLYGFNKHSGGRLTRPGYRRPRSSAGRGVAIPASVAPLPVPALASPVKVAG